MAQIWVGMQSIKESLRLLESNAAEEDWDTRYWTWVDREILAEAATLAEGTEQDVEPVALDSADPAVDADVQPGLGSGPALAAEAELHSGPALAAVAKLQPGPVLAVEQAAAHPAKDADDHDHAFEVPGLPALVPGLPAQEPGPGSAAEINRALAADMTVPAAAVEAAPDPDH